MLTDTFTLEELNRSHTISYSNNCNPYRTLEGWLQHTLSFVRLLTSGALATKPEH